MKVRVFLGLCALVWLPYGVYCFLAPGFLVEAAGVASTTPTGSTELRAMYGGLQAGIGAFCVGALLRPDWVRPALTMLAFLVTGLLTARLAGAALDDGWSQYTGFALGFEALLASASILFLRREG